MLWPTYFDFPMYSLRNNYLIFIFLILIFSVLVLKVLLPAAVYIPLLHQDTDNGHVPSNSHLPPSKVHQSLAAACLLPVLEFHHPGVVVKTFPTPHSPTRTPDLYLSPITWIQVYLSHLRHSSCSVHNQNPIQLASCCWPSTSYSRTSWSLTSKSCLTSPWTSLDSCYQNPQNSVFLVEYCAAFLNSTIKEI